MNRQNKKIILLVLFIAAAILLRFFLIGDALNLENLNKERTFLKTLVHAHYVFSVLIFIVVYIVFAALSIPGAAILTLAGGFMYGTIQTTLYVNVGATIGATLAFLAARHLLGSWLHERYAIHLRAFNEEMQKNGARYLLAVRLLPAIPFFLINILAGFANIRLSTFIWTTALGILPGTAAFAYAGQQVGTITSTSDILSGRIIITFIVLALVALIPALFVRFRNARRGQH